MLVTQPLLLSLIIQMATLPQYLFLLIFALQLHHLFTGEAKTLILTNNCNSTVWPSIVTTSTGSIQFNDSGFALHQGESRVIPVQTEWNGRVWGRTLCSANKSTGNNFICQTGDCGTGSIQCSTAASFNSQAPATLAEFSFSQVANNRDSYDVSVVDGYNLPLLVAPSGVESGATCDFTGCVFDLVGSCPGELQARLENNGSIIGCRSACEVFKTEEFCCSTSTYCKRSTYSLVFKKPCPRAVSYALDEDTDTFSCASSRTSSYNITFCPSPTMSRLLSLPPSEALSESPSVPPSTLSVLAPTPLPPTTNSTTKPGKLQFWYRA